ncbi:1-acyl-sn-glycerol-3-phosphate acyltransferase [uncultured Tessaracoccus sp.]|uniref:lysophospholipid acyltransferase family protein n=1 Tax=uncultured Tessaracoccus sp. TaxID=905023 RepID=UPI0025E16EEF|nr:lysophospholipid acyltransferase family protein [uncultured Tessaracoccus sp.]
MLTYLFFKHTIFRPLVRWGFRTKVIGLDNVPRHGGAVLASNHLHAMDSVVIPAMVPRIVTFPAKAELFHGHDVPTKIVAWFLKAIKMVPMERGGGRASAKSLQAISDVLAEGNLVAIYPEGTRSPDGRLYKGHTGVARMALLNDVPVLPVGVVGTGTRKGRFGIRWLRRPLIVIGEPLHFPEHADTHDIRVHREVTDRIMAEIQRLTGQRYVDVYGARVKHGDMRGADVDALELPTPLDRPERESGTATS